MEWSNLNALCEVWSKRSLIQKPLILQSHWNKTLEMTTIASHLVNVWGLGRDWIGRKGARGDLSWGGDWSILLDNGIMVDLSHCCYRSLSSLPFSLHPPSLTPFLAFIPLFFYFSLLFFLSSVYLPTYFPAIHRYLYQDHIIVVFQLMIFFCM